MCVREAGDLKFHALAENIGQVARIFRQIFVRIGAHRAISVIVVRGHGPCQRLTGQSCRNGKQEPRDRRGAEEADGDDDDEEERKRRMRSQGGTERPTQNQAVHR